MKKTLVFLLVVSSFLTIADDDYRRDGRNGDRGNNSSRDGSRDGSNDTRGGRRGNDRNSGNNNSSSNSTYNNNSSYNNRNNDRRSDDRRSDSRYDDRRSDSRYDDRRNDSRYDDRRSNGPSRDGSYDTRGNGPYSPYRHTPDHSYRSHNTRYYYPRDYQRSYTNYVYLNRWLRISIGHSNGYYYYNDYPYYIYNGYSHRYSNYDNCNYELVDSWTNQVERTYYAYTCAMGYDLCADARDDLNYYERQNRFFCAEKYEYYY